MFEHVRIVMVNTSHPGNIGAAARAMKTMGLTRLYLVAPELFPHHEATARAAGADDLLANAQVTTDLPTALADCQHTYAFSVRQRHLSWPIWEPPAAAAAINQLSQSSPNNTPQVALVFGRESSGLTNAELCLCQQQICIPTNEAYSSLNVAAAIQVMTYELRMDYLKNAAAVAAPTAERQLANQTELQGFYQHLQQTLIDLAILNPEQPKMLMRRLQRLFNRAALDSVEINILRGLLGAVNKQNHPR